MGDIKVKLDSQEELPQEMECTSEICSDCDNRGRCPCPYKWEKKYMRWVVGYIDHNSGKVVFKPFDYKNDALEFMEIEGKVCSWVRLYEEVLNQETA